jgi:hypothetical protein
MTDPIVIDSPLSRTVIVQGEALRICIYRLETGTKWTLEVIDEQFTSTVWGDSFDTEEAALAGALQAIEEEGLGAFKNKTIH